MRHINVTFYTSRRKKASWVEVEKCSFRFIVEDLFYDAIYRVVVAYEGVRNAPITRENLVVDFWKYQYRKSLQIDIEKFVRYCFQQALDGEIVCQRYVPDILSYSRMEVMELSSLMREGLRDIARIGVDVPERTLSLYCRRVSFQPKQATFI